MSDQPSPTSMDVDKQPDINSQDNSSSLFQKDSLFEVHTKSTDNQELTENDKKSDDSDQTSNKSRELKSLLALSKEANLKTNISYKRKKDVRDSPRSFSDSDSKKSFKLASESKNFKFPVTAEAELEELQENEYIKVVKRKRDSFSEIPSGIDTDESFKRNKKTAHGDYKIFKVNKDIFCWRCHREGVNIACETCPRSYHQKCLKQTITDYTHWPCPECVAILKAESTQTRSSAMKGMTLEHLCSLLKFAVNRMIQCQGSEPFLHPVNIKEFPEYKKYIIQPMDLTMLEKNIKDNIYGSTQAFEADAKWLLHNSIIFNSYQSKLTSSVKTMIKICKQEMIEIENCPSCYLKANTNKSTWFVEVCPKPHILVWAKLKGFPYWPAKAMSVSSSGMVDVRFFGAHDRAWVNYKECYLYSEKDPNTFKQKRFDIEKCVEELNLYIDNLKKIYGEFRYAPFRTPLNPEDIYKQLTIFLPKYKAVQSRRKSVRDSLEVKSDEQTGTKTESIPKEELIDEPEKSETSSNTYSNINSPIQDNDTTMEGYGTDDEMQPEIDHESRKAFVGKKGSSIDQIEDEFDEDDTQVATNVSLDNTLPRCKVRTRGGFNNPTGKLKVLPRMSLENRISDDVSSASLKTSRRNSDLSVKSDSSRVSNVSDKINRVDIAEDMEITLGNEDVGCVSISENISPINSENSRSESDHNFDIKKKPVQIDIENAEFSISPNKVKISDQLIKRLTTDNKKVDGIKKSLEKIAEPSTSNSKKWSNIDVNGDVKSSVGPKNDDKIENKISKNDSIKEKFKSKIIQSYVTVIPKILEQDVQISKNENNYSTEQNLKSKAEIHSENKNPSTKDVDSSQTVQNDITEKNMQPEIEAAIKVTENSDLEKSNVASKKIIDDISKNIDKTLDLDTEKVIQVSTSHKEPLNDLSEEYFTKNSQNDKIISSESQNKKITKQFLNKDIQLISISESKINKKKLSEKEMLDNMHILLEKTVEVSKPIDGISSSVNDNKLLVKPTSIPENHKETPQKQLTIEEFEEEEDTTDKIVCEKKNIYDIIHSSLKLGDKKLNKGKDKEVEEEDNHNINKIMYDKRNIFAVIHSSLKLGTKEPDKETAEMNKTEPEKEVTNKRKSILEETHTPAKIVKLVSIESILNKKDLLETSEKPNEKNNCEKNDSQVSENCISPEDIKSELESEDELMNDSFQMEQKRKYLSALNIHEKTVELQKKEKNEIRTRSKAEEKRERFKVVDNLTRIIDDVAMNYSALHDGEKIPQRNPERRKSNSSLPLHEGEIYVKSFAKIPTPPPGKQRARKTFPMPLYFKPTLKIPITKKDILRKEQPPQKILNSMMTPKPLQERIITSSPNTFLKNAPIYTPTSVAASVSLPHPTTCSSVSQTSGGTSPHTSPSLVPVSYGMVTSSSQGLGTTTSLAMGHVILAGATGSYCGSNTSLNSVHQQTASLSACPPSSQTPQSLIKGIMQHPNLRTSQNYIPHDDTECPSPPVNVVNVINHSLNELINPQQPSEIPTPAITETTTSLNTTTILPLTASIEQEDEFAVLNGLVPESVSRAVSELLLRPPPRLKPRPPGVTSQNFEEGIPSTAGDVTAKINSIAHRMTDYFRGMLIETLEDVGKTTTPEAKIVTLQLEIEALKHRHNLEMAEMRKNMCTILKDIQRSIVEERDKIVDETRTACESETIRRVELAKSKQWCANCPKEAQFYCCWNTSYCDYPCQQKHWPQHAGKCTQSIEKVTGTGPVPPPRTGGQPIVLRPALVPPKPMGRIIAKPAKVYMNKANVPQKNVKTVSTSGLTLVETTPGNYELVGNGSIGLTGKIFTTNATVTNTKYKSSPASTGTSPRSSDQTRQPTSSGNKSQYII